MNKIKYTNKDWKNGWPPWHRAFFIKLFPSHRNVILLQIGNCVFRLFNYNLWGWKPRWWTYRSGFGILCSVFTWAGFDINYARKKRLP